MTKIQARFIGGPRDGEVEAFPATPLQIRVAMPVLPSIDEQLDACFKPEGENRPVNFETHLYELDTSVFYKYVGKEKNSGIC